MNSNVFNFITPDVSFIDWKRLIDFYWWSNHYLTRTEHRFNFKIKSIFKLNSFVKPLQKASVDEIAEAKELAPYVLTTTQINPVV